MSVNRELSADEDDWSILCESERRVPSDGRTDEVGWVRKK